MAIDILTDLNITLLGGAVSTPTISGTYDTGDAGTYVPGKDFSDSDDVSTGGTVNYSLSISFSSKSGEIYNLDKVYIQSADDPKTDGTGTVPIYWINQNNDPQDITDDGNYTALDSIRASISSIVLDSTSNINSATILDTNFGVEDLGIYWKTKIAPIVRVAAEKDGIVAYSEPIQLEDVRLSAKGFVSSQITYSEDYFPIKFFNSDEKTGINVSYDLIINNNISGYIYSSNLLDDPIYDTITFSTTFTAMVNSENIPLETANFTIIPHNNYDLVSYDYQNDVLTFTLRYNNTSSTAQAHITLTAFLPYDPLDLESGEVSISGYWTSMPAFTEFENSYLFNLYQDGRVQRSGEVSFIPFIPDPEYPPRISDVVYLTAENAINYSLNVSYYSCISMKDSVFINLLDSKIESFTDSVSGFFSGINNSGSSFNSILPSEYYEIKFGYYEFPEVYDPNLISDQVLNGIIPMKSYEEIIAEGHKPNILTTTITNELIQTYDVNTEDNYYINFLTSPIEMITQSDFKDLYNQNPVNSFPSYYYLYTSLKSCYRTVEEAYTSAGSYMYNAPNTDSFELRGDSVFLNLGTEDKGYATSIDRFNANSNANFIKPLDSIEANLKYSLVTRQGSFISDVKEVTNYTNEYLIYITETSVLGTDNAATTIPKDTTVSVVLSQELIPYLYISSTPYVNITGLSGVDMQVPINDYSISGKTIKVKIPMEITVVPSVICIPVKFLLTDKDVDMQFVSLDFDNPLLYKEDPDSLIYGFDTNSMMFNIANIITAPFKLRGTRQDTTGLSVLPTVYPFGKTVNYMAVVKNMTFTPYSDYYMALTVPTNKYNPVETSNNELPAYIKSLDPKNPDTVIYYQTESDVVQTDIDVVKNIDDSSIDNLKDYYNNVIVNNWKLYVANQELPEDVVMAVGFTPEITTEEDALRIDYEVLVELPEYSMTDAEYDLYLNDAIFIYFSSVANIASASNTVQIQNSIPEALPVEKNPASQNQALKLGNPITFSVFFVAPSDNHTYENFRITDTLQNALSIDLENINAFVYPDIPINNFIVSTDSQSNTIYIDIENTDEIAGSLIMVNITGIISSLEIDVDPLYMQQLIKNTASLTVNGDPVLTTNSGEVIVQLTVPVPIQKSPEEQSIIISENNHVYFDLSFYAPNDPRIAFLNIEDVLDKNLSANIPGFIVKDSDGADVQFNASVIPEDNKVTINIVNTPGIYNKTITVTMDCILVNTEFMPVSGAIQNTATIIANNNQILSLDSNTVNVQWRGKFNVIFESNGGSPVDTQSVYDGDTAMKPGDPTKTDEIFEGWYTDDGTFVDPWDFDNDIVTQNITLYAKWKVKCNVNFVCNGGTPVDPQTVYSGDTASEPNVPVRSGYNFAGWYTDDGTFYSNWDFDSDVVMQDITLYAKWVRLTDNLLRDQAITDLIQSVALQEAAISHILNAEGEKMQAIIAMPDILPEQLLDLNISVNKLVNAAMRLEMIFNAKMELFR